MRLLGWWSWLQCLLVLLGQEVGQSLVGKLHQQRGLRGFGARSKLTSLLVGGT